jgi:putative ABC transport system substrate-binding protein
MPLAASAQERVRRVGVLIPGTADNPDFQARVGAFLQGLGVLGWTIGQNVRIDIRWATPNAGEVRRHAAELAALAPDAIVAHGGAGVGALLQATRTLPIVFPVIGESRRRRVRRQLGAARRQRHRLHAVRIRHCREMA